MWDYNKLFAEGNIIGFSPIKDEVINLVCSKSNHNIDGIRNFYSNNDLSYIDMKIQYIIRLDEHGNVIEKLFDRERDMKNLMPELEDGMFVRLANIDNFKESTLSYVDLNRDKFISQDGSYDKISDMKNWRLTKIVEIYPSTIKCFATCYSEEAVWRSSDYQKYLDSKGK